MSRIQTSGICCACQERISGKLIQQHLTSCLQRPAGTSRAFDLRVQSGPYWLYVEASAKATLEGLDDLLRKTWVECCGHLSAFDIAGKRYQADTGGIDGMWVGVVRGRPDQGMDARLGEVLRPGLKFRYEYDFGSTTELKLEVLSERRGSSGKRTIRILARNDPPEIPCEACPEAKRAAAEKICTECETPLCGACAKRHDGCEEEMRLPLVNSPRAGVCGYSGSREDR